MRSLPKYSSKSERKEKNTTDLIVTSASPGELFYQKFYFIRRTTCSKYKPTGGSLKPRFSTSDIEMVSSSFFKLECVRQKRAKRFRRGTYLHSSVIQHTSRQNANQRHGQRRLNWSDANWMILRSLPFCDACICMLMLCRVAQLVGNDTEGANGLMAQISFQCIQQKRAAVHDSFFLFFFYKCTMCLLEKTELTKEEVGKHTNLTCGFLLQSFMVHELIQHHNSPQIYSAYNK